MNTLTSGQITSAPGKLASGYFGYVDSVLGGMLSASFDISRALDSAALGLARFNVEIQKWQVESFQYHYPLAREWAQKIKSDPKGATRQIEDFFTRNYFSIGNDAGKMFWLSFAPRSWLAGDTSDFPCAGIIAGLAGYYFAMLRLNQHAIQTGNGFQQLVKNTSQQVLGVSGSYNYPDAEIQALAQASPYGGDYAMANFDYLCFPLPLICAICATDSLAFQNLMAILFSPEIQNIHDRIVADLERMKPVGSPMTDSKGKTFWQLPVNTVNPSTSPNLEPIATVQDLMQGYIYYYKAYGYNSDPFESQYMEPTPAQAQEDALFSADWFLPLFVQALPTYFMGPRFLLPFMQPNQPGWTKSDVPPLSQAYFSYLGYLKNSEYYKLYLSRWEDSQVAQLKNSGHWPGLGISAQLSGTGAYDFKTALVTDLDSVTPENAPALPLLSATQKTWAFALAGAAGLYLLLGRR